MQVRYQPGPDRVLWQLRTSDGDLFAVWLTRRMLRQLWPPLQQLVAQTGLQRVAPHATVLPEAQAMLAQAVRERPLATARFNEAFNTAGLRHPLGTEPLLPEAIDLGPRSDRPGIRLRVRESGTRHFALQLDEDLSAGLLRLMEHALREADWGLAAPAAAPALPEKPATLN